MKVWEEGSRNGTDFTGMAARDRDDADARALAVSSPPHLVGGGDEVRPLRSDVPNKKSARRGTDTKNGSRRDIDAA
ncbi:hypothetical protein [Burkholderia sp. AW49-1]